jgi:hypothetical protein
LEPPERYAGRQVRFVIGFLAEELFEPLQRTAAADPALILGDGVAGGAPDGAQAFRLGERFGELVPLVPPQAAPFGETLLIGGIKEQRLPDRNRRRQAQAVGHRRILASFPPVASHPANFGLEIGDPGALGPRELQARGVHLESTPVRLWDSVRHR